jgi:anti-sigma factor (TIGR02949 family)
VIGGWLGRLLGRMNDREALDCEQVRRRVHAMLDGDLTPAKRRAVERHLRRCRQCFSRYEFAAMMRRLTREQVTRVRAPAGLRRAVRAIPRREPARTGNRPRPRVD